MTDFKALCAAIEAGAGQEAVGQLADLLEEQGDRRAPGLRRIFHDGRLWPVEMKIPAGIVYGWTPNVADKWSPFSRYTVGLLKKYGAITYGGHLFCSTAVACDRLSHPRPGRLVR